jgi:5-methylcytosine-specific restriction endonuclease McrA
MPNPAYGSAQLGIPLEEYAARLDAGEKWCTSCKRWHPRSAFGSDASRGDGLSTACIVSRVVTKIGPGRRERREMVARGSAWCSECAAWLSLGDVRNGKCRSHINEEARRIYARNAAAVARRKSVRKRNLDPVPEWWREEKFEEFGGLCAYGCGRPAAALDHVWPVAKGGESRPDNLVPSCVTCNSSKKDRDYRPWLEKLAEAFPEQYIHLFDLSLHLVGVLDDDEAQRADIRAVSA